MARSRKAKFQTYLLFVMFIKVSPIKVLIQTQKQTNKKLALNLIKNLTEICRVKKKKKKSSFSLF